MNKAYQLNNQFLKEKNKIKKEMSKKTLKKIDHLTIFNDSIYVNCKDTVIVHKKINDTMYACSYVTKNGKVKLVPNTDKYYKITIFQDSCQEEFKKLDRLYKTFRRNISKVKKSITSK